MSHPARGSLGSAFVREHESPEPHDLPNGDGHGQARVSVHEASASSAELLRSLSEVKGQAQFLLYLADQIEESLKQLAGEADPCHGAFLCKVLGMYSGQLESKHQGLGDKIAETCQEVYVTVREYDGV